MTACFAIRGLARQTLSPDVAFASDADVESVLLQAAVSLGYAADDVAIERVASVVAGSCIPCTDVIASVGGTRMLIAIPLLY